MLKRLLALDTSTWWGSVALVERCSGEDAPRIVAEAGERIDDSHAEHLLQWIDRLLADAGWPKTSLDGYVATRGPGSFTGIRVALGTVRGLSLATGRPSLGITTLEAIAEAHGPGERDRHVVMDAGRGEWYAAGYDADSSPPRSTEPPWVGPVSAVLSGAVRANATILLGPGTKTQLPSEAEMIPAPDRIAGAAGRLAMMRATRTAAAEPLAPLYIRPPDALLKRRP